MIDAFALGISHFLLALMALRLLSRPELDRELDREDLPK